MGRNSIVGPADDPTSPVVTMAMVQRAFRRTQIPSSELVVQPPKGRTLVNFDTLFHTEATEFTRRLRLLGTRIDLRIRPVSFRWVTGDGAAFRTSGPGVAYEEGRSMSDYVSHRYTRAGSVRPHVEVTWRAEARLGGGAWRQVPGVVVASSPEVDLEVVEARAQLIEGP